MRTIVFIFFLMPLTIFSQRADSVWFFGEQAGIDFRVTPPTAIMNSAMQAYDNTSTITDLNGNLVFYTNGVKAWNKNHQQMPNGNNLGATLSSGQSALIVPQPNSTKYYIFTVGYASGDAFRYSIVDISLNGGLGDVTTKANQLLSGSTEKIDATFNPNDTSYWVMTHAWNSQGYYCYKVNSNGLQSSPIITNIGSTHSGGNPNGYNAVGQMSFSNDGTKLASAIYDDGKIEVFNFDKATGHLSGTIYLTGFFRPWGIAFSPNNRFLYYTEWYGDKVYQLDLISGVASTILSTKTIVGTGTFPNTTSGYKIGYIEDAPDGKLYLAKFGQNYISAINNPDLQGTNCGFVDNAVYLGNGKTCDAGLSRTVNVYNVIQHCENTYRDSLTICENDSFLFNGNYYKPPAILTDTLLDANGCDSIIIIKVFSHPLPSVSLGNDTSLCTGDSIFLFGSGNYNSVLWNTGATIDTILVSAGGKYWIEVSDTLCSNSDSILVLDLSQSYISISDTTICEGDSWQITLPAQNQYLWSDGSTFRSIELFDSGSYNVQITDVCKIYTDSFVLTTEDCNCKIFVPNVFTPNGDGLNENFFPVISCDLDGYHLYIFNRWGNLLFETEDQYAVWDGQYKGKPVPDGVYFYLIEYVHLRTSPKKKEKRGSVTVLR